jgi:hypothetical protein
VLIFVFYLILCAIRHRVCCKQVWTLPGTWPPCLSPLNTEHLLNARASQALALPVVLSPCHGGQAIPKGITTSTPGTCSRLDKRFAAAERPTSLFTDLKNSQPSRVFPDSERHFVCCQL